MEPNKKTDLTDRRLFLLDAMALAYRSFYAFYSNPRVNSKGENTSTVYGFTNTLLFLIREYGLEYGAIVLDRSETTFRNELYPDYKAHRKPTPEAILKNLPLIRKVAKALHIPVMEAAGYEADDLIGTLARKAEAAGARALIVSPDKDFKQLLSDHIEIWKPSRSGFDIFTAQKFREQYDLVPEQFIDILALWGDSADNVPGILGVGEKTAVRLLKIYKTLENTIANASDIRYKRAREGLLANPDLARLSKELVTIKTDVDLEFNWSAMRRGSIKAPPVLRTLTGLEFTTMVNRLRGTVDSLETDQPDINEETSTSITQYSPELVDYRIVTTRAELVQLQRSMRKMPVLSISSVFSDNPAIRADWVGIALSWIENAAWYIPVPLPDDTSAEEICRILAPVFANPNQEKIGHGLKPLLTKLSLMNVPVRGSIFDTEVAHYLLSPDQAHRIPPVAREYLTYEPKKWDQLLGTGRSKRSIREVDHEEIKVLACERADCALKLRDKLWNELIDKGLDKIATDLEFPLMSVLADMEATGVLLDLQILDHIEPQLQEEIDNLKKRIHALAGVDFNVGSSKQVAEVLYDKLKLPAKEKTASGQRSTRKDALLRLVTDQGAEIAGLIVDWRAAAKLKSTNVDGLRKYVYPDTQRVHTVFNQTTAATGRLSSSDPALQNIPVRESTGREIRSAFVAPDRWLLLSADYSQIELRILAHMSQDEGLSTIFATDRDPHTETAARIYGVDASDVTREQRGKAKAVNYGIPYGLSATGLARQLRCKRSEAMDLIRIYHTSFPGIGVFLKLQVQKARDDGYAVTLWGRRRYLPDLKARNPVVRAAAERIAINMPIQGTQADMIKAASVDIDRRLRHEGMRMRAILQVHDELVFEVPEYEREMAKDLVLDAMINALKLNVPVEVQLNFGANWLEVH